MTSFTKSIGTAKEQSRVAFLHRAQEQLMGDGGSYHGKVGFKDLRKKLTKYPLSSHTKGQFVVEQARLIKNNSPTTRRPGHRTEVQARRAIGIIQPVNEAGEQGLARMRYNEGLSVPLERLFWAAVRFQTSVQILKKTKARQGSRRAKETPRMANAMN